MQRETAQIEVQDMKCSGCADRIEAVLGRLDGVQAADTDLEEKTTTVRYDADRTASDALLDAIKKAGYSPTPS